MLLASSLHEQCSNGFTNTVLKKKNTDKANLPKHSFTFYYCHVDKISMWHLLVFLSTFCNVDNICMRHFCMTRDNTKHYINVWIVVQQTFIIKHDSTASDSSFWCGSVNVSENIAERIVDWHFIFPQMYAVMKTVSGQHDNKAHEAKRFCCFRKCFRGKQQNAQSWPS